MNKDAFTISQFCEGHEISRAFFYTLQKEGRAPKVVKLKAKRLITVEAAREWREKLDADVVE